MRSAGRTCLLRLELGMSSHLDDICYCGSLLHCRDGQSATRIFEYYIVVYSICIRLSTIEEVGPIGYLVSARDVNKDWILKAKARAKY